MKDWTQIKERYLRDDLSVRLGGLAANLSRIRSFSTNEANRDVVESLIDESKMFIEWTAAQVEVNNAEKLVELQIQLAFWQLQWSKIWPDASGRTQISEQSGLWSIQILEMSGLLK